MTTTRSPFIRTRRVLAALLFCGAYALSHAATADAAIAPPVHDDARIVETLATLSACVDGDEIAPCQGPDYIVLSDGIRDDEAAVIVVFDSGTVDFYPGR